MTTGGPIEGAPESLFDELGLPSREVNVGANNHHANWLECIRTRRPPSNHEEIGHRSASLGHLANIACWIGHSLKWDPVAEVFTDSHGCQPPAAPSDARALASLRILLRTRP